MSLDPVVARKWPDMAAVLDPHGLHARFEASDDEAEDDSIEISLAQEEIGSVQIMAADDYDDAVDRYVAGVWTSATMDARAHGPVRDDAATACADLVGLAGRWKRLTVV